jgi:hypothetical protein
LKRKRNLGFWKKSIFTFIPLIILFLSVEVICRWVAYNRFSPYFTNFKIQANLRVEGHPLTAWRNRPFYLNPEKGFQYNQYGMRVMPGDVYMPKKGKDDFWVFLFGGRRWPALGQISEGASVN